MSDSFAPTGLVERILCAIFPFTDISHAESLYLRRWLLTPQIFGWRLMLHRITRPDKERVLHCHPWQFVTWCLRGGYDELVFGPGGISTESLHSFSVRFRAAEHTHRIETIIGPNAWTLVLHGKHSRTWGFWDTSVFPAKFTPAPEYFRDDYNEAKPPTRRFRWGNAR